jgi:hypothetical protein
LEILVNDQPLAFVLESERTLGEVVQGLERWLAGSPLVLCSVRLAGRELLAEPPAAWAETPHAGVERLEVTVRHTAELRVANLQTMQEFLQLAIAFAAGGAGGNPAGGVAELARGYPLFLESLARHFAEAETGEERTALSPLFAAGDWGPEDRTRLGTAAASLALKIQSRLAELTDPRTALRSLGEELEAAAAGVSEVSVLLATGRDRQAMQAVVAFSELTQRLLALVRSIPEVGGRPAAEYFGELNRVLKELIQAFQARDTVLVGDLLEYEIAPRLRQLRAVL